jgi:hypothetical protein
MRFFLLALLPAGLFAQTSSDQQLFVANVALASRIPNYRYTGIAQVEKSATFSLTLAKESAAAYIEVLSTDRDTQVTITAPNGQALAFSADAPYEPARLESLFPITKLETHHPVSSGGGSTIVSFGTAPAGVYKVEIHRATPGKTRIGALLVPLMRVATDVFGIDRELEYALAAGGYGPPLLVPYPSDGPIFAGEPIELKVGLVGGPLQAPPKFNVLVDRIDDLVGTSEPAAVVTSFVKGPDGIYRGTVTIPHPEFVQIRVEASGRQISGQPFQARETLLNDEVQAPVATLVSFGARPVDQNGDGVLDGLNVEAVLDIVKPGLYKMKFQAGPAAFGEVEKRLGTGMQAISQTLSSDQILAEFVQTVEITDLSIEMEEEQSSAISTFFVSTRGRTARVNIDRSVKWERSKAYGAPRVAVHGIHAAPSGKFRFLDAEREVLTQGGRCVWTASLRPRGSSLIAYTEASLILPPGRQTVHLIFDGREIANWRQKQFEVTLSGSCDSQGDWQSMQVPAVLDPTQLEPPSGSLAMHLRRAVVEIRPGYSDGPEVQVIGARQPLHWSIVGDLPAGVEFSPNDQRLLDGSGWLQFRANANAAPGRSLVVLKVDDGKQDATAAFLLDVLQGR